MALVLGKPLSKSTMAMEDVMIMYRVLFRCASISWFQVVSESVSDVFTASAFTGLSDFFTCLKLHFLIATKFFINTYLNYQTLVLFLVAKTSADNLSQGFRTELPLTYRLPSPRPPLPISFSLLTTSTSLLLSPYTPRRSKKTVLVQVLLFCLRVESNWAPKTNPAITFK